MQTRGKQYMRLIGLLTSRVKSRLILTAMEYKTRFDMANKHSDETHVLFASRLHNEFRYYLSSRGVDNFVKLCNLLVSDKLKSCLAPGTLNYVCR